MMPPHDTGTRNAVKEATSDAAPIQSIRFQAPGIRVRSVGPVVVSLPGDQGTLVDVQCFSPG
jgi:hypothetical protein